MSTEKVEAPKENEASFEDKSIINNPIVEDNVLVDKSDSSFSQSKYFWTFVLLFIAGVFYGITYAFKNLQIKFALYCGCVWLVCLALICLANYRSDQTASVPTSSSSSA